jgi:hypothetical protein
MRVHWPQVHTHAHTARAPYIWQSRVPSAALGAGVRCRGRSTPLACDALGTLMHAMRVAPGVRCRLRVTTSGCHTTWRMSAKASRRTPRRAMARQPRCAWSRAACMQAAARWTTGMCCAPRSLTRSALSRTSAKSTACTARRYAAVRALCAHACALLLPACVHAHACVYCAQ